MKALSAHHFLLCRQTLPAARAYRGELEAALNEIGVSQSLDFAAPAGLLLIVSDLGLCADYNIRLVQTAVDQVRRAGAGPFYCVGRRPRAVLARNQIVPNRLYTAPTSVDGLPGLLLKLAQDLLDDFGRQKMSSLQVVSARLEGAGRFSPVSTRVLPIELAQLSAPVRPTSYQSQRRLAAVALREYLYTTLHELLLDALASEHGMRLVAAESARLAGRNQRDRSTAALRHPPRSHHARSVGHCRRVQSSQGRVTSLAGFNTSRRWWLA